METENEKELLLGVARADITPEVGCRLYGYNDSTFAKEIHDGLSAAAFAFRYGEERAILITATVCLIHDSIAGKIREEIAGVCGVPFRNVLLAATHTHTGPCTTGTAGWGGIDEEYVNGIFIPQILKAAKEASEMMTPVTVGIGKGESRVGVNRREFRRDGTVALGQRAWGPFNPTMTVLSFRNAEGKTVANLIHYGCHGTAAGRIETVSRDFSGMMCDMLEKKTGGITAFINGPEGDVGPRISNGRTVGGNISYVEELGTVAGLDAIRIGSSITGYHKVGMECFSGCVRLPLLPRKSLEAAKAELAKRPDNRVNIDGQITKHLEDIVASYENGYTEREADDVPQTILRIGSAAIVSFPCEVFSEIGLRISKEAKIENVLCLSNTNGSKGYFVTESELCLGGYEVNMFKTRDVQLYAPFADTALVNETLKNLEELTCTE